MSAAERDVYIAIYRDANENVTIAHLHDTHTGELLSTGSAKRTPGDPRHSCVGDNLAVGRAFKTFGESLIKHATALSEASSK